MLFWDVYAIFRVKYNEIPSPWKIESGKMCRKNCIHSKITKIDSVPILSRNFEIPILICPQNTIIAIMFDCSIFF